MSEYTESVQSKPPTGFTETPPELCSVGGLRCLTDEAQPAEGDMGQEHPAGDSDARPFEVGSCDEVAYDDVALPTCQPEALPMKPVTQLSEALWLAQEELAEEQRRRKRTAHNQDVTLKISRPHFCIANAPLRKYEFFSGQRAEERRQFAIVQDEYLRLQVESARTSRRHTAAEASAAACRSLAAEALADKEYVVRILGKTHQELRTLSSFLDAILPQVKAKVCELVAQGNTIVALLASRWPEAELREQIDASGLSDQPLAQWAILHSIKTRGPQKGASLKNSALLGPAEQRRSGVQKRHPMPQIEGTRSGDTPSVSNAVSALEATGKYGAPAADSQLSFIPETSRSEAAAKVDPSVGIDAVGSSRSADNRETCQHSQDSAGSSERGDAAVIARMPQSAELEWRTDITERAPFAEGKSLDLSPLASALPIRESVTQCRPKLPDAATSLPSKITRQAVPPLPLGRGPGQRSAMPSARELNPAYSLNWFLPRKDGGGEAPASAARKASVRKARTCKEQGMSHREAQHNSSRPASVRSVSRSGMKQVKGTLAHAGPSMLVGTGADVRVTQPVSAASALRTGSLPSRKTCGAVLSGGSSEVSKRAAVKTILRDTDGDAFARKALRQLSSAEASKGSSPPYPVASSPVNVPQQPKKKLPPLPPSLRNPSFTHEEGSYQHLGRPAASVSAVTCQEESLKGACAPTGASTNQVEVGGAAVSAPARTVQTGQMTKSLTGQPTIYKATDATGTRGTVEHRSSTVLRPLVPLQDVGLQDFSLPCLPLKAFVASESGPWPGTQQPFLTKVKGGGSNEGSEGVQRHLSNPPAAAGAQNRKSEASRQHVSCELNVPRNASGPPGGAAVRGPASSHQQLPPGTTLRAPGEWPLKPSYAAPQRSSLPAGFSKGLSLTPQPPVQQPRRYAPPGAVDYVLRPAAAVPQRQTVLPTASSSAGLQQQNLMQQHQLRQQQLMYQALYARQAFHLQQQMGAGGLQFFLNNGGPAFVARQHAPPWSPVYSGAMGR
ncbi:hypothetical protein Esti_000493 [Eimeria stiedai]